MYYFSNKPEPPKNTMYLNCVHYTHTSTSENHTKSIAFNHHNHESFEILAVKKGNLHIQINNLEYKLNEKDVIIVNPYNLHYGEWVENGKENEYICITFSVSKWLDYRNSILFNERTQLIECLCCFDEFYNNNDELYSLIANLSTHFQEKDAASECLTASDMYALLSYLFKNHYHKTNQITEQKRNIEFIRDVSIYLVDHYRENISTEDIAKAFFMTVPAFCYKFKKNFGTKFLIYLCKYRITQAIEIYSRDKIALDVLAETVGFNDYSYFSRVFHKYIGESPSNYFEKRKKQRLKKD